MREARISRRCHADPLFCRSSSTRPSPGARNLLAQVELLPVASGFNSPIAVTGAGDGSGRLFIVGQAGVIRIWDGDAALAQPFLDISSLIDDEGGGQGLLGLGSIRSSSNGFYFVNYTYDPGAGRERTRIARYQVSSSEADVADEIGRAHV